MTNSSRSSYRDKTPLLICLAAVGILLLSACSNPPEQLIVNPSDERHFARGRELVLGVAACGRCHGAESSPKSPLSGGQEFHDTYGTVSAPNLTTPELKEWSALQHVNLLRKGMRPDGSRIAQEHHQGYEWLADQDAFAIAAYLKSLPPVEHQVERRSLSFVDRYTKGFLENTTTVAGYIPPLPRNEPRAYGKYLVDHVAACTSCHNTPATLFQEEQYLQGGRSITRGSITSLAPNITTQSTFGIGEWSQEEIATYLTSGRIPGSTFQQSEICPTEFYTYAPREDIAAIAVYLNSVDPDLNE